MTEEEIDRIARAVADKIELKMRREGAWPVGLTWPRLPEAPQWWQPGGSPTCGVTLAATETTSYN